MDSEQAAPTMENNEDVSTDFEDETCRLRFARRQSLRPKNECSKEDKGAAIRKLSLILQKAESERTEEETGVLNENAEDVKRMQSRWKKRDAAKKRMQEFEEPMDELREKCRTLARAIAQAQHLVVYTGAGISTAARIPDYRGPDGIWTRLQQGKEIGNHDLSLAEPTFTHMALSQLYHQNILKYVVSQNCDGLHMRSGLPRYALSELHGNMYVEVCKTCKPAREYWRQFDVTENTARFSHKTSRRCYFCNSPLMDTIVHFGERGSLQWPLNWSGASKNAQKATTILCLGSSLKVLKRYPWLWQMDKPAKKRPNLYIVNLQWTPKDDCANVKIHGRCDVVMEIVMGLLGITVSGYNKHKDPIFFHSTALCEKEFHTTNQPELKCEFEDEPPQPPPPAIFQNQSDCDIKCNTIVKVEETKKCDFSINGLLRTDTQSSTIAAQSALTANLLPPYYPALIAYCQMSNAFLLQNPLLSYQDMSYYPFQTTFLYSGFHSIINPFPLLTNDNTYLEEFVKTTTVQETPSCTFCFKHYNAMSCLFYQKFQPVFAKPIYRQSKSSPEKKEILACLCCDYSTDEEDAEEEAGKSGEDTNEAKTKIQAGWFGKGYKKIKRNRKR